jgi:4-diphosphocytidyl-2C-methyl-D-erythritol kinase
LPETWFVLLFPLYSEVAGKTGRLYSLLNKGHYTDGAATQRLAGDLARGRFDPSLLYNVFESVASQVFGGIEAQMQAMRDAGAERVHLAGSGPTLYALVRDEGHGEAVARRLTSGGHRCVVTHSAGQSP